MFIDKEKREKEFRRCQMNKKRNTFTGSIGFVLAAAGSAVGLGNIWRFPYLAAKDGGGLFLFIYIFLALTFGFTLLTTEIAIGRKTVESPLTAYKRLHPKWGFLGIISYIIPALILPYYCVIGGWVLKYFTVYATGQDAEAAKSDYFSNYITSQYAPIVFLFIFAFAAGFVVFLGVQNGIEKVSKVLMPILVLLIVGIAIYSITLKHTDDQGVTRSGLQGMAVYFIPDFTGITLERFLQIVVDAMGQLFYSLSVAMGIMIAYGSYLKKDANMMGSINQIEIFDTAIALLAGLMIIPAVYTFMGPDAMSAGPGLMFISLPKVFEAMGKIGVVVGFVFFFMVLFAALTSAISLMEAIVSSMIDRFKWSRRRSTAAAVLLVLIVGTIVCLGYNLLYFELPLPNGSTGQILDVFDFISNSWLMPVDAILTCILVGWVVKPQFVIDEVECTGHKFLRKGIYLVMLRYICPILLFVLLLQSLGVI